MKFLRGFASCLFALPLALALPLPAAGLPAFPGAEGFGANTPGGRGGRVLFVTNLDDAGPGSLRAACEADGPRIVIFRVAGTIALKRAITVTKPFLTVAGQSAPGDGVCLRDAPFGIATHDVVVRYLRSRLGDESRLEADCIDLLNGAHDCILDHCSATWSVDECLSTSGVNANCTIQWCLIGESLNQSKHAKGKHGYGSLARANGPVSWHHNLWIHNDARNPRLGDNYGRGPTFPTFDVRNNVMYDYGATASGLTQGILKVNYVANYLRPGPSSRARTPITVGNPSDLQYFIRDNIIEGNDALTAENAKFFSAVEFEGRRQVQTVGQPFAAPPVKTVSAQEALELVLATVGASLPVRDAVDARLVNHVRTRTGKLIDSQTEVGGWPELKSGPLPADTDNDGIPDSWETPRGLNPRDASDAATLAQSGYSNIEEYLNHLASSKP
ncbi:MAG: pectate lyase [Verrucomicrobia bacterium]|nr:pectate lyase [Verrucomicrobiota bacterium]